MKMHEDYTMLISLVLDGEATPAEQDQLEKHLRECATCGMLWENWRAMDRLLATAPSVSAPPGLLESLLARIAVHEARQARRRWMALGAAAAFIILAILMGVMATALSLVWGQPAALSSGGLRLLEALAASAVQIFGGVAWAGRSAATLLGGLGWHGLALGLGGYLVLAGTLIWTWLWVLGRTRVWAVTPVALRQGGGL
jgi:anti-sigma factor RsiW